MKFPQISLNAEFLPEDKKFAKKLIKEFNLSPADNVYEFVYNLRILLDFLPEYNKVKPIKALSLYLSNPDKSIKISTDAGEIEINSIDPEFKYFKSALHKVRDNIQTDVVKSKKRMYDKIVEDIIYQLKNLYEGWWPDKQFNQHALIGMILIHFELSNDPDKLYDTEDTYNSKIYQDFKHYAGIIGESRMRKLKRKPKK